MQCCLVN
jgi:hypothetical protein